MYDDIKAFIESLPADDPRRIEYEMKNIYYIVTTGKGF